MAQTLVQIHFLRAGIHLRIHFLRAGTHSNGHFLLRIVKVVYSQRRIKIFLGGGVGGGGGTE